MTELTTIEQEIAALLVKQIPQSTIESVLGETHLIQSGIMDSIAILEFIAALEGHFAIMLNDQDLTPEHFNSVSLIAALVERYRNSK
ncbi:MAG TPA: acyl carrier protein [Magnetovibrio sp.]